MSGDLTSEVVLPFAGGDHLFRLSLRQIQQLQSECDSGIGAIARRLLSGDAYIADIIGVIRLGLIGGGMSPADAKRLVETHIAGPDAAPLAANVDGGPLLTARAVMAAVWLGIPKPAVESEQGNGPAATAG